MTRSRTLPLLVIGAVGIGVRLFLAFHWFGNGDLLTFEIVARRTLDDPLHSYAGNVGSSAVLYPYPPGYLLWLVGAYKVAQAFDRPFADVVQLLPIAADVLVAVAVYIYLGWRGATDGERLAGFALVMIGPVFVTISGYHGQLDSLAMLTGVLALMAWERLGGGRAWTSGLLLGVGGLLKTVPLLLFVPLVTSARSLREAIKLAAAAGGLVILGCLPFLLAEPDGFREVLAWSGVPGRGGLSLIVDPIFASDRRLSPLLSVVGHPNGLADWLSRANGVTTIIMLLALAAFLLRYRPAPVDGAVLMWLAVYVFSVNFLLQYVIWGLPFFLVAGYLRETALLQIALIPLCVITYLDADTMTRFLADGYVVMMAALWLIWVIALLLLARRIIRRGRPAPGANMPPLRSLRAAVEAATD
jgi:uncharacterized membrane protein